MHGAIDLGGTKIEAALLNADLIPIKRQRIDTPKDDYEQLLKAIQSQINWLRSTANDEQLSIGIGVPGVVDKKNGLTLTSNLPTKGRKLRQDISNLAGQDIPLENDCRCFALSEANDGAGAGYKKIFGLIIGTGIGGGICIDGKLSYGFNNLAAEVSHIPLPSTMVAKYNLPLLQCGCGRTACYETFVAGPGLSRLAQHLAEVNLTAIEISARAEAGDEKMIHVLDVWVELCSHMLDMIQLLVDPDCIILGGGISLIKNIEQKLLAGMKKVALDNTHPPHLLLAKFGDSSGVRGAAMLPLLDNLEE
ncbi:MAG: N-acetylglucosamine kinase [Hyphomicrobiales bacterium]|nr:MAG: N-acetylglucosamine kinase [Hyphomicrobiales bacterium]